jgi:hypothetical protein
MVMAKYCIGCSEQIHPKRVEILPNTKTCVACSTTGAKRGIPVLHGNVDKDDTWVDMVFMEADEYENYMEQEGKLKRIVASSPKAEYQDYDTNFEEPTQQSFEEE